MSQKVKFLTWLVKQNMSMRDFAKKCGCSHQYISAVINGKKPVNINTIDLFKKGGYDLNGKK